MANNNSTKKRIRQSEKRKIRNAQNKSAMRTISKKLISLIEAKGDKNAEAIAKQQKVFEKVVDTNAQKKVIHWKKAARLKSRMAHKVNALTKA